MPSPGPPKCRKPRGASESDMDAGGPSPERCGKQRERQTGSSGLVTVKLYGHLATLAGTGEYTTSPATVGDILADLMCRLPEATARHLVDPHRNVFNIHLVLGDENLALPGTLERDLDAGDTLKVVSSVAGG